MENCEQETEEENKETEIDYERNAQGLQIVLSAFQIREQILKDGYCPGSIKAIADTMKLIADEYTS